jgi:hypothetical protein
MLFATGYYGLILLATLACISAEQVPLHDTAVAVNNTMTTHIVPSMESDKPEWFRWHGRSYPMRSLPPNTTITSDPDPSGVPKEASYHFYNLHSGADKPGNPFRKTVELWGADLASDCGTSCAAYEHNTCWGLTIIRTSYDDDDAFERAVSALRRLNKLVLELDRDHNFHNENDPTPVTENFHLPGTDLRVTGHGPQSMHDTYQGIIKIARAAVPADTPLTHETIQMLHIWSSFHNIIVQDKTVLDGADVSAAWEFYHDSNLAERVEGIRSMFFVLLDREAIEHLASAPTDEELSTMTYLERLRVAFDYHIKAVNTDRDDPEDDEHLDEDYVKTPGDPEDRRRIRILDYLDILSELQHCQFAELGYEKYNLRPAKERDGYVDYRDWDFVDNHEHSYQTREWIKEFYDHKSE